MLMLRSTNQSAPHRPRLSHKIEASRYESYPQQASVIAHAALALGVAVALGAAIALMASALLA
ncbi:hypothetical protein [Methylovirgula sp. 4M-Z18]|uniref:hypothetical protein n=1 Tax=Methylovirgula sp. 4M-Z18 TaxID=2293567 RepID=UPI000E2F4699|nr:hypothetical protein [Methylovirgula sp. 4M-Z18]RFB80067.1 hypothetical protein DYH55_00505 [Methylovirgula sp. 4M-Z18]